MKKLFSMLFAVLTCATFLFGSPVMAADLDNGAKVFSNNCASCHAGGGNVINQAKTLKRADLEKYNMDSIEAITTQVRQGKMAMPSFIGSLSDKDIEDVAAYVLVKAEKGW